MIASKSNASRKNNNKWCKPFEEAFADINLKSLSVVCPQCKGIGRITTRWIKGPTLKPIYVFHNKSKKVRKICELTQEQSTELRQKVSIVKSDIQNLLETRKSFVLFSGGKDSLATLMYLKDLTKNTDSNLTAIYVDTTAGLPENTRYVRKVCRYLGVTLKVVKPKVDYFTLAKKWGIPSFGYRWCCRELKIKPIEEYLDKIKEPKVVFDGIRAAESNLRKQYIPIWYHPSFKCLSVSPLFHWNDNQVVSFINSNGIPKTLLHSLGSSTECWCGAYKTETDFMKLYDINKEMFRKLVKLEEANKNGYTFLYKNGQRIPLRDVEKKVLQNRSQNHS